MEARDVRCPTCFAPADATRMVSTCRYCGATLAIHGPGAAQAVANAQAHGPPGALMLEAAGSNAIAVIKVIREHTGLGLKESKDLLDRAPVVVAQWDPPRMAAFHDALVKAGARARIH